MKTITCYTLIIISLGIFPSCHNLADPGPIDILNHRKKGHPEQAYKVFDITESNIMDFNKNTKKIKNSQPPLTKSKTYGDKIQYGDRLKLLVLDNRQAGMVQGSMIMGPFEVDNKGLISVPHIGLIDTTNRTLKSIESKIHQHFKTISNSAQVSLSRDSRQLLRANVTGIVNKPGQQPLDRKGVTITDLIARGGGTNLEPYLCLYNLHRSGKSYPLSIEQIRKHSIPVQDGDLLEVTRNQNRYVSVFGKSGRQKNQAFTSEHTHLSDILAESGGLNGRSSDASGVFVFRLKPNGEKHIYRFNLKSANGLFAARSFHVRGRDILYIAEAPLSRWNRALKDFLSLSEVSSIANLSRIAN